MIGNLLGVLADWCNVKGLLPNNSSLKCWCNCERNVKAKQKWEDSEDEKTQSCNKIYISENICSDSSREI